MIKHIKRVSLKVRRNLMSIEKFWDYVTKLVRKKGFVVQWK